MVFWTTEELKVGSVTGTLSNKHKFLGQTEVKPALSPEKLNSMKEIDENDMNIFLDEGGEVFGTHPPANDSFVKPCPLMVDRLTLVKPSSSPSSFALRKRGSAADAATTIGLPHAAKLFRTTTWSIFEATYFTVCL
ncbi:hypothetical protein HPB50_016469 [Hyalomma asiaticum]|uniref:Uncharacterized protein n=1 Tax=Hyalomma asiaticum TaxID=266040 RepID=A0ACB7TLH9_HYAAI|nr:hypothetical protein HPB50_016469 [Hyalomma asiaticum]